SGLRQDARPDPDLPRPDPDLQDDDTDVLQDEYVRFDTHDLDFEHSKEFIEEDIYQDAKFFDDGSTLFDNDGLTETILKKGSDEIYLYQQWLADNYSLYIDINDRDLEQ
ncbi:hypothetical protein RM530_18355, partial [Algiphilus sp. W345]